MIGFEIDADDATLLTLLQSEERPPNPLIAVIDTTANGGKGVTDFVRLGFLWRDGEVTVFG